jgi:hypothetical protein
MTYPITPNPGIHNAPAQSNFATGQGAAAQLEAWAKQLPLAMTLDLINVILQALGLGAYTGPVDGILTALSTALTGRFQALGVLLEAVWTAITTDYNDWPLLIAALEAAWKAYVLEVTELDEAEIVTLIEIIGALLGFSPQEIQRLIADFDALEADSEAKAAAFTLLLQTWWTDITTDYADWPVLIAAMEAAWKTYITTISDIDESEVLTLEDIVGALLGISAQNLQELNNDFADLQEDSTLRSAAFTTLFQTVWTDITTESGSTLLASLEAAWNTYISTVTTISSGEVATLEDIAAAIFGVPPANVAAVYNDVVGFLTTGSWTDLSGAWDDLKQGIFGNATNTSAIGNISAASVTNVANSIQPVPDFPYAQSIQAASTWSWDGTVGHTAVGSAKVIANGTEQVLRGVVGDVQAAQVITATAYVQWSGLTATGSPIQLQLLPNTGTPVVIGEITSPGSSGSWTELTGTYTVPSSGVTTVQILLVVTSAATAGSIWFDDCTDDASGGFLPTLSADFTALQTDYNAKAAALTTFLTAVWTDVTTDTPGNLGSGWWTTLIANLESAWHTYVSTISSINSSEIVTLENIVGSILGLSPATLQTLNTDFGILQTDFTAGNTAFATLLSTAWTVIEDDLGNWLALISGLEGAWDTYVTTVSALTSGEFATLRQIINALLGINTTTGQMPTSNIGSGLGLASLEQDLANFWDNLFGVGNSPTTAPVAATALPTINIGGVLDTIENHIQAIVDHSIQALTGGSSTNNPTSAMYSNLTAIPAGNIVGSLSGTSVAFGATGGGSSNYQLSGATVTASWSHTIATGDNYVVVAVNFYTTKVFANVVYAATYGGASMASLGVVEYNSGFCGIALFGLAAPASGSKSVVISVSGGVGTAIAIAGNSVSYSGWSSTSAATTASGAQSTSVALTVASQTGDAVVQVFGLAGSGSAALSSYNGTTRWNEGTVSEGDAITMVMGDAEGASSVVFDATASSPSTQVWGSIAVSLKPAT